MTSTTIATMPLRVGIGDDESVDSWIEALARRNGTSPLVVLHAVGAGLSLRHARQLLADNGDPALLRRLEHAAGLPVGRLDTAASRDPVSITDCLVSGRSRYCPQCLADDHGRWRSSWRSRWHTSCPRHHALLHDTCPACGDSPRRILAGGIHPVAAGTCTHLVTPPRGRCGTDLAWANPLPAPDHVLGDQEWIESMTAAARCEDADTAIVEAWRELPLVVDWLIANDLDTANRDAHGLNPEREATVHNQDGKPKQLDAALTAALLARARIVLDGDERDAIDLIRRVWADNSRTHRFPPVGIDFRQWQSMGPRFPNRYLRAMDPEMAAMARLRLKTPIASAARAVADTTPRMRAMPQMLWPDWTARLLPAAGFNPELLRAAFSVLLMLPGSRITGPARYAQTLNPRIRAGNLTVLLQGMSKLPTGSAVTDVIAVLCRIADHLDITGSPIDYQRRRELIPAETITWPQWRDLSCGLDAHPGENNPTGRIQLAQRYLHELLVGVDLADRRHPMAFRNASDRSRHMTFLTDLTPQLRRALREHAEGLLVDLGIDEPITWSPPADLAAGLALPGIDPADLDTDKIRRLVVEERRLPGDVAELLGIHLEHVRLVLAGLDRPRPRWAKSASPVAWQLDRDAERLLTHDYFEREYIQAGRTLRDIGEETGFGKPRVSRIAKQLGITLNKGRRAFHIDPDWLREQYCDRMRSTADIATELGVEQMTVNEALHRFGIPARPSGVFSRREFLTTLDDSIPARIKTAVEGQLHGWLRLHRYQVAMAFPNLTTAADYLRTNTALTVPFQKLEQQMGGPLYHRAALGRHQKPTQLGQDLLHDLDRPDVQELMSTALGDKTRPMPDADTISAARAAVAPPARPRPRAKKPPVQRGPSVKEIAKQAALQRKQDFERPFADLTVRRLPITARSTLDILRDLLSHADEEIHGLGVLHRTGYTEGSVYQTLKRLEKAGWLTSHIEDHAAHRARVSGMRNPGKPRTLYRLTPDGRTAAQRELDCPQIQESVKPLRRNDRKTVEKPPDTWR